MCLQTYPRPGYTITQMPRSANGDALTDWQWPGKMSTNNF